MTITYMASYPTLRQMTRDSQPNDPTAHRVSKYIALLGQTQATEGRIPSG